jgi:hypothetical protein
VPTGTIGAARGVGVLPLHPCRAGALLQETGVVHDQDRLGITEVLDHVTAHVVENLIGVPFDPVQHPLDVVRAAMTGFFGGRVNLTADPDC